MRTIVKHFFFSKQTLIIQFENVNFSSRLADIAFLCHLLLGRLLEHNPHFLLSPMLPWRLVSLVEKRRGEFATPAQPRTHTHTHRKELLPNDSRHPVPNATHKL